jgi:medium-chain acyl-[acyl-carrier-protein] hydrolase
MGALVSFELARQIRRQCGKEPVHLFVSGCFAPQIPDPHPIHDLPEAKFLDELRRLNGIPMDVLDNDEMLQLMLPTLRGDCMLTETYTYTSQPPLGCPISVFGGLRDPLFDRDHLEAWREQTSADFSLHMFPGDHFFLNTVQPSLLGILSRELHQTIRRISQA